MSRFPFVLLSLLHLCYYCSYEKSQWMARSRVSFLDPLIAHPEPLTRIRKVILLFCLPWWGSFLFSDIYDGTVFICSRQRIVWPSQGREIIYITWCQRERRGSTSSHRLSHWRPLDTRKSTSSFFSFFFSGLVCTPVSLPFFPSSHQTGTGVIKLVADFLLPLLFLLYISFFFLSWKWTKRKSPPFGFFLSLISLSTDT